MFDGSPQLVKSQNICTRTPQPSCVCGARRGVVGGAALGKRKKGEVKKRIKERKPVMGRGSLWGEELEKREACDVKTFAGGCRIFEGRRKDKGRRSRRREEACRG